MRAVIHDDDPPAVTARLRASMSASGLTVCQLWLRYASFGGSATPFAVDAIINDALPATPIDLLMLNHAAWELATFPTG